MCLNHLNTPLHSPLQNNLHSYYSPNLFNPDPISNWLIFLKINLKVINKLTNFSLFTVNYLEMFEDKYFFLILAKIFIMHKTALVYSQIKSRFVKIFCRNTFSQSKCCINRSFRAERSVFKRPIKPKKKQLKI